MVESAMPRKKPKKSKSRKSKSAAAILAAACVGVASVVGHDDKHIELKEVQPGLEFAIMGDGGIIATNTVVSTVTLTKGKFVGKIE
jgi:hypothetical protein